MRKMKMNRTIELDRAEIARRISSRLILILGLLFLFSCSSCDLLFRWKKDVEMDGINYKKLRHIKSGTIIGNLSKDSVVQDYPCKAGWIHFYEDSTLQNFTLLDSMSINGVDIPAKTWVTLNKQGELIRCAFPENIKIQGYWCRGSGGPKGVMVSFHPNGKIKRFFAPKTVEIDGVPCKGSIFHIIGLHGNGRLMECTLARSVVLQGVTYKKGKKLYFDKKGNVLPST